MSALYRCALFSRVSRFKPGVMQVVRFGYNVSPPQKKTPDSVLRNTASTQTAAHLRTVADQLERRSLSSSRCLSTSASTADGSARVRRVSIEGNIGKISMCTAAVPSCECRFFCDPVLCFISNHQLLESPPLQGSCSQLAQTGRWWQSLSASGRTLRVGPRRCAHFLTTDSLSVSLSLSLSLNIYVYVYIYILSQQKPKEAKLTTSACVSDRGQMCPLPRLQSATCCR